MSRPHLALFFKDFAAWIRSSCVGLHVAGFTTAKALRAHGVDVSVFPVRHNVDLVHAIDSYNETHDEPLTHVVISAPWLSTFDLKTVIENWPNIKFVILSHSNVGFLQADPGGVALLRSYVELASWHSNLQVGGNSRRFAEWLGYAYDSETIWLPNVYPFEPCEMKKWNGGVIKIGAFGAVRPEKNFMTAAAAAVAVRKHFGVPLEFHMSGGGEGDHGLTAPAIEQMCADLDGVTLIRHAWESWDKFIEIVGGMDLLFQLSYTESFNMVTADGISRGVPSVVSSAIAWAPECWKADADDVMQAARVGIHLLTSERSRRTGFDALHQHNKTAVAEWLKWLGLSCAHHDENIIYEMLRAAFTPFTARF